LVQRRNSIFPSRILGPVSVTPDCWEALEALLIAVQTGKYLVIAEWAAAVGGAYDMVQGQRACAPRMLVSLLQQQSVVVATKKMRYPSSLEISIGLEVHGRSRVSGWASRQDGGRKRMLLVERSLQGVAGSFKSKKCKR
jgi:hypothetical protein